MPVESRGALKPPLRPVSLQSKSTPNLPTLHSLDDDGAGSPESPEVVTSPSEPASIDDFSLDSSHGPPLSEGTSDDEDGSEEEDGAPVANLPPRPIFHHHSRSQTYLAPSTFAPPFYNRPPTPLPPSPSLTSLLRPNFSGQSSRPSTPDPSSDEGTPHTRHTGPGTGPGTGAHTPNSVAASALTSSFRTAKPIPRASPKVPTYEYYGFTLYLASSLAFIVYLLWSFLPSPFLHQLGIYYYPNRWWALAIPAWAVMLIVYIYVALASYNTGSLTLALDSVECLVDDAANVAVVDARGNILHPDRPSWRSPSPEGPRAGRRPARDPEGPSRRASLVRVKTTQALDWRTLWNEGTDAVMDIPLGGVCEMLYGSDHNAEAREVDAPG